MVFPEPKSEKVRRFRTSGENCIIRPEHLGAANGHITVGTPHDHVAGIDGLFAPPYASADFSFDIRLCGEQIRTEKWAWYPNMVFREGSAGTIHVESLLTLTAEARSAVLTVAVQNRGSEERSVPWTIHLDGGLDYVHDWAFSTPTTPKRGDVSAENAVILMKNSGKAYAVRASMEGLKWFAAAHLWEGATTIPAGATVEVLFSIQIGSLEFVRRSLHEDMAEMRRSAYTDLEARTEDLFTKLPQVHSSDAQIEAFYNRALLPFLLNVWDVKEFVLRPYFSTGSVRGGCLASYLWDFAAGAKILPMFDPEAVKAQIKAYFHIDIFKSYAILPVSGNANGPWYPVNQEKIVDMVYQYVLITGDTGFLSECAEGKTVLEWIEENALFGCDGDDPGLIDYGVDGESHLELRRGYPYHGVLPDLNARRYETFQKAAALFRLCGKSDRKLLDYAEKLKAEIREKLWSEERQWFRFLTDGREAFRWTVQMFKLCDSGVLDEHMREGLLSHLNETEFLSTYGLHSMSKLDPAYDQIDIDNGGGGACSIFPILIAEKLYRIGKNEAADDMLRRILWWGTRMPYWGDSLVANYVDYRQDTPLQCTIGGIAGAQLFLFGICGVSPAADGTVTVSPHLPTFASDLSVENIHLHGKTFSVSLTKDGYTVVSDGNAFSYAYGETMMV